MEVFINFISYYLPERTLSNVDIESQFPEWTIDKISSKTGIFNRHISASNQCASDLAINASLNLFEEYKIDKNSIDYIILCTQSPDYFLPTTACLIQNHLGLKTSVGAVDVNQGCSGFIYALGLAKGLILSSQAKNVLVLTADTYSKYIHPKDKNNKTLFGDGAAAVFVSSKPDGLGAKINSFIYGTDGSGYDKLIVKNGAFRNIHGDSIDYYEEGVFVKNDNHLYMDGRAVFQFTNTVVPSLVNEILEKECLKIEEIDKFVFHQANKFMLDKLRQRLAIPEEKFIFNSEQVGNTVSSTIPISLKKLIESASIHQGEKIVLSGFGVGLSYGATIITIKEK
jgi:3-oxoacyl-[acyl-carrier-protein] synthase-3